MGESWIKLHRTPCTRELLREKDAFHLLTVIALRAKRTMDFNVEGLKLGEALIGDHRNYQMTRQEYRTAMKKLKKWGFATFRTTNKGTIAKLINKRIYDINEESQQPPEQPSANHQATSQQPSNNHRPTTNKNDKNEKKEEEKDNKSPPGLKLSSEQIAARNLLIRYGVAEAVASLLVCEHTPESLEAAVKNAVAKKAELDKTDKLRAHQFKLAGYIVGTLNQAREETHGVDESKRVQKIKADAKRRREYKPPTKEEFEAEKKEQLARLGQTEERDQAGRPEKETPLDQNT